MCHSDITFKQLKIQQMIVLEVLRMKNHSRVERWFRGPEFMWKPFSPWENKVDCFEVDEDDKEIKNIKINSAQIPSDILSTLESRIFSWKKMKRVLAYLMLFINKRKQKQLSKIQEVRSKEDLLRENL